MDLRTALELTTIEQQLLDEAMATVNARVDAAWDASLELKQGARRDPKSS